MIKKIIISILIIAVIAAGCFIFMRPPATETDGYYRLNKEYVSNKVSLTMTKFEDFTPENILIQPKEGYKIVRAYFIFKNLGNDKALFGTSNFTCYADDCACDVYVWGSNTEDIPITKVVDNGRSLKGWVYFQIPIETKVFEIEYRENILDKDSVIFRPT